MSEECYEHDWTPTHCIKCGLFLGNACENCLTISDGGDWMASQEDAWCHCQNPISDFHFEQDDDEEARDDFHHSRHMDGQE